jgi:hypothetical protein
MSHPAGVTRLRSIAVAGSLALATVAAPVVVALTAGAGQAVAGPCLAWYGNKEDGICLGTSNGNGVTIGTPDFGVYGPDSGVGVSSGPLLPGRTWTRSAG